MKILIAVPTFENIMPDTFKGLYDLDKGGHECDFEFVRGYDCAAARNKIAWLTLESGYDAVLMVDNDVVLPHDALVNLVSDGVGVVSGFYQRRTARNAPDGKSCVLSLGEFNFTVDHMIPTAELVDMAKRGEYLMEIHGCGMGCVLIRKGVFERLKYPWFSWVSYESGATLSEDLHFCADCGRAKIPVYVDARVGCGHMLRRVVWPEG